MDKVRENIKIRNGKQTSRYTVTYTLWCCIFISFEKLTDLDECIADDFPFLLRVGGHIQGLADALPGRPVLLRDGKCCRSVVESVSCIYHWGEQHCRGEKEEGRRQNWVMINTKMYIEPHQRQNTCSLIIILSILLYLGLQQTVIVIINYHIYSTI